MTGNQRNQPGRPLLSPDNQDKTPRSPRTVSKERACARGREAKQTDPSAGSGKATDGGRHASRKRPASPVERRLDKAKATKEERDRRPPANTHSAPRRHRSEGGSGTEPRRTMRRRSRHEDPPKKNERKNNPLPKCSVPRTGQKSKGKTHKERKKHSENRHEPSKPQPQMNSESNEQKHKRCFRTRGRERPAEFQTRTGRARPPQAGTGACAKDALDPRGRRRTWKREDSAVDRCCSLSFS